MKIFGALVTFLALAATASASNTVKTSILTSIQVDKQITDFDPAHQQMGGSISIDFEKQTATIGVSMSAYCPNPTTPCPKYIRRVIGETLPIVDVKTDTACGETIYVAKDDKRPVDGALLQLQITDNGTIDPKKCTFVRAPDPVTATYTTDFNGRTGRVQTESTFIGEALK